MQHDSAAIWLTLALFGAAAVVVIVMQHNQSTAQILSSLGGSASASASATFGLGSSVSLAGTPTPGQQGSAIPPPVYALNTYPGYLLQ